jgi:hypothetical protein
LEDTKQIGFFLTFIEKAIHGIFQLAEMHQ